MKRIEVKSIQDGIVAQMSRAILDGDIATGTELTQVELANDLGVSRMPVREALFALEHQGLITRLPNNHCRVVRPTRRQLARILELCRVVEADVLSCLDERGAQELPTEEMAFHAALREACGEGYPRRVLTTTASVYVAYLVETGRAHAIDRTEVLRRVRDCARAADYDAASSALSDYFALLMQDCPFEEESAATASEVAGVVSGGEA